MESVAVSRGQAAPLKMSTFRLLNVIAAAHCKCARARPYIQLDNACAAVLLSSAGAYG